MRDLDLERFLDERDAENYEKHQVEVLIHPNPQDEHREYQISLEVTTYNGVPTDAEISTMSRVLYSYTTGKVLHSEEVYHDDMPHYIAEAAKQRAMDQVAERNFR
jgi:uncharacterized lipoprotein YmbA